MKKLFIPVFYSLIPFLGLLLFLPTLTFIAPIEESSPPDKILMETTMNEPDGICQIDTIVLEDRSLCKGFETLDHTDDYFWIDVSVWFTDRPVTGNLEISHPDIIGGITSIPVSIIGAVDSFRFDSIVFQATPAAQDIDLTATFTSTLNCTLTQDSITSTRKQCSVCDGDLFKSSYPNCWPKQNLLDPCTQSINHAPHPDYPELTPIRYIKTIVHVFQREYPDVDSLGKWIPHPTDPMNFTIDDTLLLRSWFEGAGGANDFLQNLCDDPTDGSPHMRDARIRFLNKAEVGVDLFFHPDNRAWGTGKGGCGDDHSQNNYSGARSRYVTNVSTTNPYYNELTSSDVQNAYHVFVTGGTWVPNNLIGHPDIPDSLDCIYLCGSGGTSDMGCTGVHPPNRPTAYIAGSYGAWLASQGLYDNCTYDGTSAGLGKSIMGEIFHVLSVDHISPLQNHINHNNGGGVGHIDGCADTPAGSIYNQLDCHHQTRCALTECQIGRMHHFFEQLKPAIERFPDGEGGFTSTPDYCKVTIPDIVIPNGANIVWNGPRTLRTNVIVQDGASLTINCDVGVPTEAGFTVQRGGRLIIDGARIFNNCESEFWRGITVEGTDNPQFPLNSNGQGLLYIKPGSTIENAANVEVDKGALLFAQAADFINCGAVLLTDYDKYSFSRLMGCKFIRDTAFYHYGYWPSQVGLHNVNRMLVSGCDFETVFDPTSINNGVAIQAFSSNFEVRSTSISNFYVGIEGSPWLTNPTGVFSIKQCTLSNNNTAIANHACNNVEIQDNLIQGIGDHIASNSHTGLLLENCTGFEVHDNKFYGGSSNPTNRYGIIATNTGAESNQIELNKFRDLYAANQAEGTNNDPLQPFTGLQYFCNENETGNSFDFLIMDDGIASSQGGLNLSTGNSFSYYNTTDGDFRNVSDVNIDYFHLNTSGQVPMNFYNIAPFQINTSNDCLDDDHDYPINLLELEVLLGHLFGVKEDYRTLLNLYLSLLNGGINESTLVNVINGTNAGGAAGLLQQLVTASPYLTTEVLKTFALRGDIFTEQQISTALIANPDILRNPSFQEWLYTQFSSTFVNNLLQHQGQQTARTNMEAELAGYLSGFHLSANQLIKHELSDTLGLDYTSYRSWLLEKDNPVATYERANSYLMQGNITRATEVRDSIPLLYDLTSAQTQEHDYYEDLSDIAIAAIQSSTHYKEFAPATVQALEVIANGSKGTAGVTAQQILNLFYGYNYQFTPQLLSPGQALNTLTPPANKPKAARKYQPLNLVPNPAKDRVAIHYNFREEGEVATLTIYDLHGRLVEQFPLVGKSGNMELDVAHFERGIYYCIIERAGSEYQTTKLVLID